MIIRHVRSGCVVASISLICCAHLLRLYISELAEVRKFVLVLHCVCVWYIRKHAERDVTAQQKEKRNPWHQFSEHIKGDHN
jgi:hypothetical protein